MSAVWLCVRAGWRRGRGATLGVILLAGFAGAVVLTLGAGVRRSSTSLDRLAAATSAGDVIVDVSEVDRPVREQIARLPMVRESGELSVVFAMVDGVDEDIGLLVPRTDAVGDGIERDRIVRGRELDPSRVDEVVVNEAAVDAIGVDVGSAITVLTMTPEQVDAEDYFPPRGPALEFEVVGVSRGAQDLGVEGEAEIRAGRDLLRSIEGRVDVYATYLGVDLVPGATVAEFEETLRGGDATSTLQMSSLDSRTESARDAISTLSAGLALFAVVAALASVVVVGFAVGRHLAAAAAEQPVMLALGMSRSARVASLVLLAVPIAVGGAATAVAGAVLASPSMPIGLARRAEPDPGISIDWLVLPIGFLGVALTVVGTAALAGWRIVRTRASDRPTMPSRARIVANRSGARPVVATGVELAFDRRPPAAASRSALVGVTVAVVAVSGIVVFSASLDRLLASPERWGYAWQLMVNFTSADVVAAADELSADARFADVARWDSGYSRVNDRGTRAFGLTQLRGQIGYVLRSGRQPAAVDEVVLGPETAEALDVTTGDVVNVAGSAELPPAPVRVVGIAYFPEVDEGDLTDAVGFLGSGFAEYAVVPDPFEASQVVVNLAPGNSVEETVSSLSDRYPDSISEESLPTRPRGVQNLTGVRRLPAAIATFVVVLGLASLAHVLSTTVRRRRRELGTLRCLGLTPRQIAGCIVWQSVTIGAVAVAIGTPLGMIAGRAAWWAVTDPIGVRPDLVRSFAGLTALGAGTLVVATLLATLPAWRAARADPAQALRAE